MPLVPCPDCSEQISTLAPVCPRCGRPSEHSATPSATKHPVTVELTDKKQKEAMVVSVLVMIFGVFLWGASILPALGVLLAIGGVVGFLSAEYAAWWNNG